MCGGSLFASCCGLFSRFERGGSRALYVRACPVFGTYGAPLLGASYRVSPT